MGTRRILITGIAGTLAGLLARALAQHDDVSHVVGVDVRDPQPGLEPDEFVRADIRNPLVARAITATRVDTVVHMSTTAAPTSAGGRARMKELNVIGAMQLLAACQRAETVDTFVLKSTTATYGSDFSDPALFREDAVPRIPPREGFAKDAAEIEGYARALARRRGDVRLAILRVANLVGPEVDSAFARLFALPAVPSVLGYDPRLQFCHTDDALAVLGRVTLERYAGILNVAGPGVVYLSQCIRLAGRVPAPVPQPLVSAVAGMLQRASRIDVSAEQLRFLQFGRVGDIGRLRSELGYEPRYSSRAAFEDFVARRGIHGVLGAEERERVEQQLRSFVRRARAVAGQEA